MFHFVSFLPIAGRLYELDGLAAGPIDHGACSADTWLATVRLTACLRDAHFFNCVLMCVVQLQVVPIIQQRIAKYSSSQIKFNLLAMVTHTHRHEMIIQLFINNT